MNWASLLLVAASLSFGQAGISFFGGPSHSGVSDVNGGVYGMSYFIASDRIPGFHEFGLVAQPFGRVRDEYLTSRPKYESWVALTTGHLFILRPWIRPGFAVGPVFAKMAELEDGKAKFGSEFAAYYAASLQVLLLTVSISNLNWGAGINLTL